MTVSHRSHASWMSRVMGPSVRRRWSQSAGQASIHRDLSSFVRGYFRYKPCPREHLRTRRETRDVRVLTLVSVGREKVLSRVLEGWIVRIDLDQCEECSDRPVEWQHVAEFLLDQQYTRQRGLAGRCDGTAARQLRDLPSRHWRCTPDAARHGLPRRCPCSARRQLCRLSRG